MSYPFGHYPQYLRPPLQLAPGIYPPPPVIPPRYLPPPNFPPGARPPNVALSIIVTLGIWMMFIAGAVLISLTFDGGGASEQGSGAVTVVHQDIRVSGQR